MSPAEVLSDDLADAARDLRRKAEPFAFATIVRTAGATAAKPGAKALLDAEGNILHGWLGGGCTRGAVRQAAQAALATGAPQLVSVAPEDVLAEQGVRPGDEIAGTRFARNGCPSRGSVDIFIEPCLPVPQLVVLGGSPVARALARMAPQFHWSVVTDLDQATATAAASSRAIVVATQGQGDLDALKSALEIPALHLAFVGSARKFSALSAKLEDRGIAPDRLAAVKAPAGLDLGAITPEEIALSILAELVACRRARAGLAHG